MRSVYNKELLKFVTNVYENSTTSGVLERVSSSFGKTKPFPLDVGITCVSMNRTDLRNSMAKFMPLLMMENAHRVLMQTGDFVRYDQAMWVSIRMIPALLTKYGECKTLSNLFISEIATTEEYRQQDVLVRELSIEPRAVDFAETKDCRYGLDHVFVQVASRHDIDNPVIVDPFLDVCCFMRDYKQHPQVVEYYRMLTDINRENTEELVLKFQFEGLKDGWFNPECVSSERLAKWCNRLIAKSSADQLMMEYSDLLEEILTVEDSELVNPDVMRALIVDMKRCEAVNGELLQKDWPSWNGNPNNTIQSGKIEVDNDLGRKRN